MAEAANSPSDTSTYPLGGQVLGARSRLADLIDRWIFVFMAGLFLLTVLVGFVPDSFALVKGVQIGLLPPLPPILHVHAVLMGSWLLLLMAQTTLVATGHRALHRKLGLTAVARIISRLCVAGSDRRTSTARATSSRNTIPSCS